MSVMIDLAWLASAPFLSIGLALPVPAQDRGELPISDLPLIDPPPATQFVAVARERGPRPVKGRSDVRITLWEIRPERRAEPAVRRRVLGWSHWSPRPMLESPEILRWQVPGEHPAGGNGYFVKVLGVDYATFEVTELLTVGQAHAIGRSGERLYLDTSEGQRILDVDSGELQPQEPEIELLACSGDDWLVGVDGRAARFDAAQGEVLRHYPGIELDEKARGFRYVEWDGGRFAVASGQFFDERGEAVHVLDFGEWSIIHSELLLWDLEAGTQQRVLARTQARGGSGRGVLPIAVRAEVAEERLHYTERFPAQGEHASLEEVDRLRDYELVTLDLTTGEELAREPLTVHPDPRPQSRGPVPEYLRRFFQESPIRVWGEEQDLAHAFLVQRGIDPELPETGVRRFRAVCRTPDGGELLVLHRDAFLHCDLETREIVRWTAPKALRRCPVDLYAVEL